MPANFALPGNCENASLVGRHLIYYINRLFQSNSALNNMFFFSLLSFANTQLMYRFTEYFRGRLDFA